MLLMQTTEAVSDTAFQLIILDEPCIATTSSGGFRYVQNAISIRFQHQADMLIAAIQVEYAKRNEFQPHEHPFRTPSGGF